MPTKLTPITDEGQLVPCLHRCLQSLQNYTRYSWDSHRDEWRREPILRPYSTHTPPMLRPYSTHTPPILHPYSAHTLAIPHTSPTLLSYSSHTPPIPHTPLIPHTSPILHTPPILHPYSSYTLLILHLYSCRELSPLSWTNMNSCHFRTLFTNSNRTDTHQLFNPSWSQGVDWPWLKSGGRLALAEVRR